MRLTSRMGRLAIMAHYSPQRGLAPHTRRQVRALAEAFDEVVVVSTSKLNDRVRRILTDHARLIERDNIGYDFMSYRTGLESAGDLSKYDEVVVCNDTYVPVGDYPTILASMERDPADFWGLTRCDFPTPHIQSYFVAFRPQVVASPAFQDFWGTMVAKNKRWSVIHAYEIGLGRVLTEADFAMSSYFTENEADRRLARRRLTWWTAHRELDQPLRTRLQRAKQPWNPYVALADEVLDEARLPLVKLGVLRYDPYGLGADRLLSMCEQRYPRRLAGIREFLEESSRFYPRRPGESLRPTPLALRPMRRLVEYRRPPARRDATPAQ